MTIQAQASSVDSPKSQPLGSTRALNLDSTAIEVTGVVGVLGSIAAYIHSLADQQRSATVIARDVAVCMKILHGTWIPDFTNDFHQGGGFYLWVETDQPRRWKDDRHPRHLPQADLADCLSQDLGFRVSPHRQLKDFIVSRFFLLPSAEKVPLPSLELSRYLEAELPDTFDWQYWRIDCYQVGTYAKGSKDYRDRLAYLFQLLPELHFIAQHQLAEIQLGADLLFWLNYSQSFKTVILKDQYIPALKYRKLKGKSSQGKSSQGKFEIYPTWEIVSRQYDEALEQAIAAMPRICGAGFSDRPATPQLYDGETLLRHFSEYLLSHLVTSTELPISFQKKIEGSLIEQCRSPKSPLLANVSPEKLETYQQWQAWRDRITRTQTNLPFWLYFVLQEPAQAESPWQLIFQVAPKSDPSLKLTLFDYWRLRKNQQKAMRQQFGEAFEQHLLLNLGYAARIYPKVWEALKTDQPHGIPLDLTTAFEFLQEAAWVLEDAGYKVIVPAWWTPEGRRRAKIKLRAQGQSAKAGQGAKSYFSVDKLISYQYELSIGGEPVSQAEWNQLVNAKAPLVHFRGQWMQLDPNKMQEMLNFWQEHQKKHPAMSLMDFMKLTAEAGDDIEVDVSRDRKLQEMLSKLHDSSQMELIEDPDQFEGNLRDYQKRGVAWLNYLEQLGFNGCLADDMGLGKTVQVIARLVQEREQAKAEIAPTLLIAPTSVVGNWLREIKKFAPQLRAMIHHGGDRLQDAKEFQSACQSMDVVITSFTLARKDAKFFQSAIWQRIVLDEAQNIKNPQAAQTKAILKLQAQHRLALTGTPVENRLLDLWSIFNFLNPGYLGKENQFRRNFERPVQRYNDPIKSATLKQLVEPFILRRVKTDPTIIKDLPDKVEQKVFCHLTQEQASLYEATVKELEGSLNNLDDGIKRKGLILATLTKLKQICNHPAQFLHDGSEFGVERSHKFQRLTEMIDEVMEEGESLLIFTQFREMGDALEHHFRHSGHYNTYYIHGGVNRDKREQMIAEFQNPETEPSIFVLSLKAGGVGITLTKANHVFHFDRWWNPAVEDQATDRAFRIGQKKNVFVHKFVAIGTLEERIDQMIEDKKKLAGVVVGNDESWLTELDNEALKRLIILNKNAVLD